jgi:hypothetical protein
MKGRSYPTPERFQQALDDVLGAGCRVHYQPLLQAAAEGTGRFNDAGYVEFLKQLVVGAVLDGHGRPVACELWSGNTTDVKALVPVAERLSRRFGIQRVCLVADRGMISAETIAELDEKL